MVREVSIKHWLASKVVIEAEVVQIRLIGARVIKTPTALVPIRLIGGPSIPSSIGRTSTGTNSLEAHRTQEVASRNGESRCAHDEKLPAKSASLATGYSTSTLLGSPTTVRVDFM